MEKAGCWCAKGCCFSIGFTGIKWVEVRPNGKRDQIFTGTDCGSTPAVGGALHNFPLQDSSVNYEHVLKCFSLLMFCTHAGGVICNHCSYIDILVLLSRYFPSFVARSNTQDMPFIGLCR